MIKELKEILDRIKLDLEIKLKETDLGVKVTKDADESQIIQVKVSDSKQGEATPV